MQNFQKATSEEEGAIWGERCEKAKRGKNDGVDRILGVHGWGCDGAESSASRRGGREAVMA